MTSLTLNQSNYQDLIKDWLQQECDGVKFPVDFDKAWKIAGYSKQSNAKRKLPQSSNGEFLSQIVKCPSKGRPKHSLSLTIKGFVLFLINSNTPNSRQIVLDMFSFLSGMAMGNVMNDEEFKGTQGFVYLIKTDTLNLYKVGMSKNPYKRMATLQTSMPYELTVISRIFSFDCPKLEKALHEYYAAYWMRGEWFDFPDKIVSEFEEVATSLDQELEVKQISETSN